MLRRYAGLAMLLSVLKYNYEVRRQGATIDNRGWFFEARWLIQKIKAQRHSCAFLAVIYDLAY